MKLFVPKQIQKNMDDIDLEEWEDLLDEMEPIKKCIFLLGKIEDADEDTLNFCYDRISNAETVSWPRNHPITFEINKLMIGNLIHDNDDYRRWACFYIARNPHIIDMETKSVAIIDMLIGIMEKDENTGVKYNAIVALGELKATDAIYPLGSMLTSEEVVERGNALSGWKDFPLSVAAFVSLSQIGLLEDSLNLERKYFDKCLELMIEFYLEAEESVRIRLIPYFVDYPTSSVKTMIRSELYSESALVRTRGGLLLTDRGWESIILTSIEVLVELKDEISIPIIAKLAIEHEHWKVNTDAMLSLVSGLGQGMRVHFDEEGFELSSVCNSHEALNALIKFINTTSWSTSYVSDERRDTVSCNIRRDGTYPYELRVIDFLSYVFFDRSNEYVAADAERDANIRILLDDAKAYWENYWLKEASEHQCMMCA